MKLPFGFRFEETMAGTWSDGRGAERPIRFTVHARSTDLGQTLRDGTVELDGTIEAEGLVAHAPARGTMLLLPLTKGIIRYELAFTGDDGKPYRLEGQKELRVADLAHTLTTLPAVIVHGDSGAETGRAMLRFDTKNDLLGFLSSWKPLVS
ncbi:MAG TPA: hypothetical protein VKN99_00600 [Polyangia bacterium]|nr:hypothetical protein [Polyangia bacterium]